MRRVITAGLAALLLGNSSCIKGTKPFEYARTLEVIYKENGFNGEFAVIKDMYGDCYVDHIERGFSTVLDEFDLARIERRRAELQSKYCEGKNEYNPMMKKVK